MPIFPDIHELYNLSESESDLLWQIPVPDRSDISKYSGSDHGEQPLQIPDTGKLLPETDASLSRSLSSYTAASGLQMPYHKQYSKSPCSLHNVPWLHIHHLQYTTYSDSLPDASQWCQQSWQPSHSPFCLPAFLSVPPSGDTHTYPMLDALFSYTSTTLEQATARQPSPIWHATLNDSSSTL